MSISFFSLLYLVAYKTGENNTYWRWSQPQRRPDPTWARPRWPSFPPHPVSMVVPEKSDIRMSLQLSVTYLLRRYPGHSTCGPGGSWRPGRAVGWCFSSGPGVSSSGCSPAAIPVKLAGAEGRGELQLAGRHSHRRHSHCHHSHRPHQVLWRPEPLPQLGWEAVHLRWPVAAVFVLPDHHLRPPAVPVAVVEVDLVVVLQTLSRGKLTLTKLTFISLSSAKPLEIGLWTLVAESLSRMGKPTRLNVFIFRVSSFFFLGLKSRLKSLIITLFYWFHLVTWWSKVNLHNVSGSYWIGSNYLTTVDFNLILFS